MREVVKTVGKELRVHAPFTLFGTLTGVAIMAILVTAHMPRSVSRGLFWTLHPFHVVLSALVTAGMYRRHSEGKLWATIVIGLVGSVGIATLSDCLIPYLGELLLNLPGKGAHIGFIEKWWLVSPLALFGIGIAYFRPRTKFPHAAHVLLSTWGSLFHITMALGANVGVFTVIVIGIFLFAAVWIPCCTSDIVFPLLFSRE